MALLASRVTSLASDRARPLGLAQPDQAELDPALKKKWFVIFLCIYLFCALYFYIIKMQILY
jgi:hypothetical protein